jgi:hypothetical protein
MYVGSMVNMPAVSMVSHRGRNKGNILGRQPDSLDQKPGSPQSFQGVLVFTGITNYFD